MEESWIFLVPYADPLHHNRWRQWAVFHWRPFSTKQKKKESRRRRKRQGRRTLAPVYINIMEPKQKNTSCWRLLISVVMLCAALCEYNRGRIEFCLDYFFKKLCVYSVSLLALLSTTSSYTQILHLTSVITLTIKYTIFNIFNRSHFNELFPCLKLCRSRWLKKKKLTKTTV